MHRTLPITALTLALIACGGNDSPRGTNQPAAPNTSLLPATPDDPACGTYADNTPEFAACEQANFARVSEAPREQASNPVFLQRMQAQSQANTLDYLMRLQADPSYAPVGPTGAPGNTPATPLCTTWALQCAGDPFRYPGVDPFYEREADVQPVVFYDRDCARLSGRVWKPKGATGLLPTVVIENGSVQAPEPLYWWMAQALVRAGYAVMTFDPRGQGRSDQQTPTGAQGSNANPAVFWEGLVDAIDFFRSTPQRPYPHNMTCEGTYPTVVTAFNPQHAVQDKDRLGIVGHSLGGTGVSVVQGYGAPGAPAWPGKLDASNPVKVAVAWDGAATPPDSNATAASPLPVGPGASQGVPAFGIRVPMMGQNSEYGLTPRPFTSTPARDAQLWPFKAWQAAGVPVFEFTIRGSTHYEWSLIPTFPATSWCPEVKGGQCVGGWGRPMAEFYTLAWLDRWLKRGGESGFDTADARLQDDARFRDRLSFYFDSARDYPARSGTRVRCETLKTGCR